MILVWGGLRSCSISFDVVYLLDSVLFFYISSVFDCFFSLSFFIHRFCDTPIAALTFAAMPNCGWCPVTAQCLASGSPPSSGPAAPATCPAAWTTTTTTCAVTQPFQVRPMGEDERRRWDECDDGDERDERRDMRAGYMVDG